MRQAKYVNSLRNSHERKFLGVPTLKRRGVPASTLSEDEGKGGAEGDAEKLGLRDYLAIFVAVLQTVALPLVVLIIILFVFLAYSSIVK